MGIDEFILYTSGADQAFERIYAVGNFTCENQCTKRKDTGTSFTFCNEDGASFVDLYQYSGWRQ